MPDFSVRLLKKELVAKDTLAVCCSKPAGFEFKAGQFAFLTLPSRNYQDDRGLRRHLSIASAPSEPDLLFATRLRGSAFKKTLAELPPGTEIILEGPQGGFTLRADVSIPTIFLAGGIGITPFLSMIRDTATHGFRRQINLFYSNRTPADAAFLGELERLAQQWLRFRLIATMTDAATSLQPWDKEREYVNENMIKKYRPDWANAIFYAAGPSVMVNAMQELARRLGVANDRIHTENFSGY